MVGGMHPGESAPRLRLGGLPQAVRFGLVGVVNTLLDWAVFWAGTRALPAVPAWRIKALSFACGVACSFLLNSRFTFRAEAERMTARGGRVHHAAARFLVVSLGCLAANAGVFQLVTVPVGAPRWAGILLATGTTFVLGLVLNRIWTFRAPAPKAP